VVNIPSTLQSAWDDVSKDGKIDKNDYIKLLEAAAPGITTAKTAEQIEPLSKEIDPDEREFLARFVPTETGKVFQVKNGSAQGSFEFIGDPQNYDNSEKPTTEKTETAPEGPMKLFEPLKLSNVQDNFTKGSAQETGEKTKTPESTDISTRAAAAEDRIKKLLILKDSLPKLLNEPELSAELAKIDVKIKKLQENLLSSQFVKAKTDIVNEASKVVNSAIAEAAATGDTALLGDAKKAVEKLCEKYEAVNNDPAFKNLNKGNDPPAEQVKKEALAQLEGAVNKINDAQKLLKKANWDEPEKTSAGNIIRDLPAGKLKTSLEETLKVQSDSKAKIAERNKANIGTTMEGLHDVIGNGFWNAQNKAGTGAMFQMLANQGMLDETVKKMNTDDQLEAIRVLISGPNIFNHAIAAKIYDNLSQSANVDKEFNKDELNKLKSNSREIANQTVDPEQFYKGIHYSLQSEKEAAMMMARGIINREVDSYVLTKFSKSEIESLVKLVDKNGTKEERENLAKVIAETYLTRKPEVNIDYMDKGAKAKIVSAALSNESVDDVKIKSIVKQMGKDVIFAAVNNEKIPDNQLARLAKFTDGDDMADNEDAAVKLLMAMIRSYNADQKGSVSLADINKFIDQVDNDWWSDDNVMRKLLKELSDGPDSDYAKFKALAPATIDKIWKISG
jgi:hypothetical protein